MTVKTWPLLEQKKLKRTKPLAFQFNKQYALIDNDHKLYGLSDQASQLYDLGKDAREENDLSSVQPKKLKALQALLGIGICPFKTVMQGDY